MKQKFKYAIAFLCGAIFFSGVSYAAESVLTARVANYKIVVNGKEKVFKNKPVLINNSTYIPLREAGEVLGASVTFNSSSGVINLSTQEQGGNTTENPKDETPINYSFQKLPITQSRNGIEITIHSVEFETVSTNFNITVKNNTENDVYVNFRNIMTYNYRVEGKQSKFAGTVDEGVFKDKVKAQSEVTGVLKKGPVAESADNLVLHASIDNRTDFYFTFAIQVK